MEADLKNLRIDRSRKQMPVEGSARGRRWIVAGIVLVILACLGWWGREYWDRAPEVELYRVPHAATGAEAGRTVILNATGYIVAHHKIEVAAKVVGRVSWIGVEKGERVEQGQVIVRLEDDEYRAQLQQAEGQLKALEARLEELLHGSRPEEIAVAAANVNRAKAELRLAETTLGRTRALVKEKVLAEQALDDAEARVHSLEAQVKALEKTHELVRIGPRQEVIDAVRGQILEAKGRVAYAETTLANTQIRAPVSGTVLERNVEKGEFVTTGFVGDRGAKGYVVSLADLRDLQVELDINQNDFARLERKQKGTITTDAYPDRKYEGVIDEISPEANRQKATVQVKVKVLEPDEYLRPDMNASVAFYREAQAADRSGRESRALVAVPAAALRGEAVFVLLGDRVARRTVRVNGSTDQGLRVEEGLSGGELVVLHPPPELQDGARVKPKGGVR